MRAILLKNPSHRRLEILSFFLIAPMIELLTGNVRLRSIAPPPIFLLTPSYGAGALFARELVVRWRGSLVSILLLGNAYGIVHEALTSLELQLTRGRSGTATAGFPEGLLPG